METCLGGRRRFIGQSLRRCLKPACISELIERAMARAALFFGQRFFRGQVSATYSMIAKVSQTVIAESALNDPTGAVLALAFAGVVASGSASLTEPLTDFVLDLGTPHVEPLTPDSFSLAIFDSAGVGIPTSFFDVFVQIDLTAADLRFKLSPPAGSRQSACATSWWL